jgi:DNA repair protein RecO (recombination protein O)
MSQARRMQLEPAWLLHHRPWSDTSRILELLTRAHGRITLFAHGARRPKSPWRSVLMPFQPLLVSWTGRGDGGTLTGAEIAGAVAALPPAQLLSAFYVNELLLRLLPKEDRHERLYDTYAATLGSLRGTPGHRALRDFERVLLEELGYGLELAHDAGSGEAVLPERYYHFEPGRGVFAEREGVAAGDALRGHDVIAVSRGELAGAPSLTAARRIFGAAIAHCLEGRSLASREVMMALRRQEQDG